MHKIILDTDPGVDDAMAIGGRADYAEALHAIISDIDNLADVDDLWDVL